ncbi:PIG-L deacetylase family protein [Algoriphagus namhaensis]|uniref:PIG-L deacetylase family protein n=1 Tax=Algoriphagus namhaensis TaxID=915353 RepID=A0ABV8AWC6_9BACT
MKRLSLVILAIIGVTLIFGPFVLIWVGRSKLHNSDINKKDELIPEMPKRRVLAFFPHPDDEITVAGTLLKLKASGHEIYLVVLTKGEAGNSPENYSKERLAQIRVGELEESARCLKVDELHLLDYSDGGLKALGLDSLKAVAQMWIDRIQPDVLISYDSKVGLYGHDDHRLTGLAMESLFLEKNGQIDFTPNQLFQVTLSPKQIEVALQLSEGFQKNYPKDRERGLPKADFSVDVQSVFSTKLQAMKSHYSQRMVFKDLMPYHDQIPAVIYSRIFDREYFHEVKK